MENIIIVSKEQYGYLVDTYKYCEYLNDRYKITYICFDENLEKMYTDNVDVIYVKKDKSLLKSLIRLNIEVVKLNYSIKKPKLIFMVYNPLSFLSKLMTLNTRIILDIRTGSVDQRDDRRQKANRKITFNTKFYKEVTVISDSLARLLKIKKYKLLPLGADYVEGNIEKSYDSLELLYVGILSNRNIECTIDGVEKFINKYGNEVKVNYKIIGYFKDENSDEYKTFINKVNQNSYIEFLGRKKHCELKKYFEASNVGISFVPITEYYNVQPPTKTFEYLSEGLVTIATGTEENKKIINDNNGVLCDDNSDSFFNALEEIYLKRKSFKSKYIKESINRYTWDSIINGGLVSIIEERE